MSRPGGGLMEEPRHTVAAIKAQVEQGEYNIDAEAVAEALLQRIGEQRRLRWERLLRGAGDGAYSECSNPRNGRFSASTKTTRGAPGRTLPIQLKATAQLRAAISAIVRAFSGTQTQSS